MVRDLELKRTVVVVEEGLGGLGGCLFITEAELKESGSRGHASQTDLLDRHL